MDGPYQKVLVGQKETYQKQLVADTRDDRILENHQCPGICEGQHRTVSEKKKNTFLELISHTSSHLQIDKGKDGKQPRRSALCTLLAP